MNQTPGGCSACFLGTGNYLVPRRYWNSFVLERRVLVEPSPIALPHLRRCGLQAEDIDVIVISHFHADHTFGWPFLALELLRHHSEAPLWVVGPPGVRAHLADMLRLAGMPDVLAAADARLDIRYIAVDGSPQDAGPLRFRAVEVEHVPHLACFGFLFERNGRTIGYSGDTRLCAGLHEIAAASDVLVLECNGPHPPSLPISHMDLHDVERLRAQHPTLPLVLTHLGAEPDLRNLPNTVVPADLETIVI